MPDIIWRKISFTLAESTQKLNRFRCSWDDYSTKKKFLEVLAEPQGLILVTGPTGSGKTVTLYSALQHLNKEEKNITSIEDPIEIQLPGINQVNINPKIGLYFPTILRALLRQDPDIIMVGEIRDEETAHITRQAAQTGHLVLSTLHALNAIETFTRLESIGMTAYHMTTSISLIIAQRLIRKLCVFCKKPDNYSVNKILLKKITKQHSHFFSAQGCNQCRNGYTGRIGIYELLPLTLDLSELIMARASLSRLRQYLSDNHFYSLEQAGLTLAAQGITSLAEVYRIIPYEHFSNE